MSKKIFTDEEVILLSKNIYVKNVSNEGITYTDEFKRIFITENQNVELPRQIFENHGFDINIIGIERVRSSGKRWRSAFLRNGVAGLKDARKFNTVRPTEKDLSLQQKYEKLEAKIKLLQVENELLKKLEILERRMRKKQ